MQEYLGDEAYAWLGVEWGLNRSTMPEEVELLEQDVKAHGCSAAAAQRLLAAHIDGWEEEPQPTLAAYLTDPLVLDNWEQAVQLRCAVSVEALNLAS